MSRKWCLVLKGVEFCVFVSVQTCCSRFTFIFEFITLNLKNKQRAFGLGLCIITYEKDLGALSLD